MDTLYMSTVQYYPGSVTAAAWRRYSGKFSREKIFINFEVLGAITCSESFLSEICVCICTQVINSHTQDRKVGGTVGAIEK